VEAEAPVDRPRLARFLLALVLALLAWRLLYHARYLLLSPFAQVTLADGQVYEDAARDLLAHPPFGSKPFFLQGLYAYVLAAGMAVVEQPIAGLYVQLVLVGLGLYATYRALRAAFGVVAGRSALALLLAYPMLAFYENKYLSSALGIACNGFALWGFVRLQQTGRARDAALFGGALGLSLLGRPNMLLAIPFALAAVVVWARARDAAPQARRGPAQLVLATALGLGLALLPMAVRNAVVVGAPEVFPSHGGGIPFFIGNNPRSQGLWNSGGGLLTGQVAFERAELAQKLGLSARPEGELDRAIGAALYARATRRTTSGSPCRSSRCASETPSTSTTSIAWVSASCSEALGSSVCRSACCWHSACWACGGSRCGTGTGERRQRGGRCAWS
jgi:hypothetical protein